MMKRILLQQHRISMLSTSSPVPLFYQRRCIHLKKTIPTKTQTTNGFQTFGLSEKLIKALEALNITKPTVVQTKTIPMALKGRGMYLVRPTSTIAHLIILYCSDVLSNAQTGTGKTLGYLVPLIERMIQSEKKEAKKNIKDIVHLPSRPRMLVLVPSRELGEQVSILLNSPYPDGGFHGNYLL